jgi:hypothetical protein
VTTLPPFVISGSARWHREVVRRGVDETPGELVAVGKRDRVHQEVDRAPGVSNRRERRVDARRVGDVAVLDDRGVDRLGQRADTLLHRLALIGERELGAMCPEGSGDSPRDRPVVRDTHDQAALAGHQRP